MDLLKQDKALEKYRIEYKKNKLTLMDEINDIKGRFDYDSLKKYNTDLRRFKKETTEAIQSGTLTSYQTYMARKWLLKTKIRNRDMLLWYLVYKYAYFNYLMKEIERNVFYEVNKHFVEETEKQCQQLTSKDYKLDYIKLTDDIFKEYDVDAATAGNMINNFNYIEEIIVWVMMSEDKANGYIRTSLRSRGPIINEVASHFNGGGHIYASGCRLHDFSEADPLISELDELCLNYNKERE